KLDANNRVLADKKAKAEAEKKNEALYNDYSKAVKANDLERAVQKYQELPEASVYREKAQESWAVVKASYIKEHIAKARALQGSGKCEEARQHAEAVLLVDDSNNEAQEVGKRCSGSAS